MANKLTPKQKETARFSIYEKIKRALINEGEDIDFAHKDGSHTTLLNMPIVIDGNELWVEIKVEIKKDEDFDGYELREMKKIFDSNKVAEQEKKKKEKEKKIAMDNEKREAKRLAKEIEKKKLSENLENAV